MFALRKALRDTSAGSGFPVRKRRAPAALCIVVVVIIASPRGVCSDHETVTLPALFGQSQERLPVPDASSQAESLKAIKELFRTEYARFKKPGEQRVLLEKLQGQIAGSEAQPIDRYVLLTEIETLASAAGDVQSALEAIDLLALDFEIEVRQRKLEILRKVAKSAKSPEQNRAIVDVASSLRDEAVDSEDFDAAVGFGSVAASASRRTKDKDLTTFINARTKEIDDLKKSLEDVRAALQVLAADAANPEANRLVGQFRCFEQGDWESGLPLLGRGDDAELRLLAEQDMAAPTETARQIALGEQWWSFGEKQRGSAQAQIRYHGLDWFERALPALSGLEKTKVEKQIANYEKIVSQRKLRGLPSGAVLAITFDEPTARTIGGVFRVKDLASQRYRLELKGPASLKPGKVGQALRLENSVGEIPGTFFTGAAPRTFCAWAKFDQVEGQGYVWDSGEQRALSHFAAVKDENWEARADAGGGRVVSTVRPDTEWHHHCLTYDGAQVIYYLDGQPIAQKRLALTTAAGPVLLNCRTDRGYMQQMMIDDMAIFTRALGQKEVQALHSAGLAQRPLIR